jgi:hypothetical protein
VAVADPVIELFAPVLVSESGGGPVERQAGHS